MRWATTIFFPRYCLAALALLAIQAVIAGHWVLAQRATVANADLFQLAPAALGNDVDGRLALYRTGRGLRSQYSTFWLRGHGHNRRRLDLASYAAVPIASMRPSIRKFAYPITEFTLRFIAMTSAWLGLGPSFAKCSGNWSRFVAETPGIAAASALRIVSAS